MSPNATEEHLDKAIRGYLNFWSEYGGAIPDLKMLINVICESLEIDKVRVLAVKYDMDKELGRTVGINDCFALLKPPENKNDIDVVSTIGNDGRVTIPAEVRRLHGIEGGDDIKLKIEPPMKVTKEMLQKKE